MMKSIQRLYFLFFGMLVLASCESQEKMPYSNDGTQKWFEASQKPFYHGVASGDPLKDAVIIWTRVTPEFQHQIEVDYLVAEDESFEKIVAKGHVHTDSTKDYTVKLDVKGLQPGTHYFYKFQALGAVSPVGRTKTLAAEKVKEVKLAVVSCSNFEFGYFNAFGRIADRKNLDAVIHLGDYIYEYAPGGYGDTSIGRIVLPPNEIVSLQDYRTRYATYRLDKDFQLAHQQHPFICIWDDHEITNDSHVSGAENHQPEEEGDYNERKKIARKVYFEWMPVRENEGQEIYRTMAYGDLVDLIMLDGRLAGRTPPVDSLTDPNYGSETQSMLGKEQLAWFKEQLKNSTATWKVVGNQVIFSELDISVLPGRTFNFDAWDGYPVERNGLIEFFEQDSIENVVILTGDSHCSWAFEVPRSGTDYRTTNEAVAIEFGTTSISSSNYDEYTSIDTVKYAEIVYQQLNPHLKYVNLSDHGYMLLTLTGDKAQADWYYVETLKTRDAKEFAGGSMLVRNGTTKLEASN
ncbi:MAG: alkaline phosphatase D family protein [Bacteroidota bacterium]